jgi:hypothetical protein
MQKKTFLIFVIILLIVMFPAMVMGQETLPQKKISIHLSNVTLPQVFDEITRLSEASFSYNPDKIDTEKKIDVQLKNLSIHQVLETILPEFKLDYVLIENKIVIRKAKEENADNQTANIPLQFFTLSGFIRDVSSGEVLIGASISIPGTSKGTMSNEYGFYSLRLEEGVYDIYYSFLGYRNVLKPISLYTDTRISIDLETESKKIAEITVSAFSANKIVRSTQTSESFMRASSIRNMPAFMGEQDVIKSLQTLPGIKFYGDGSNLFYVRGGNRDQNLILVDEAILYNPSHLLGIFSSFSPGAINNIKIYKGDIPAEYGGRLSSLIDIKTKEGNMKKFHFSGNTGLFASSLSIEGPFSKDKSSYFISARRSQLKWIFRNAAPNLEDLYFSDLNLKLNFRINDHNRLFFSTYAGKDKYIIGGNGNSSGIQWENVATTLRWNHLFSERMFSNVSFTGSRYDYDLITSRQRAEKWNSHISNFSLKTDFTWYKKPENTLKFGFLLGNYYFNPGNFESAVNPNTGIPEVPRKNTREQAVYLSSERELNDRLTLRYGARLSGWSNIGEAVEVVYDQNRQAVDTTLYPSGKRYNKYRVFEPRVSLRYMLSPYSSLKTAFTRTSQFVNLLSNSISPFTSMEVWLPASLNIKPQIAEQFVIGYQQIFGKEKYSFSIEGFYKKMRNQIDYTDHAQMLFNPFIEGELLFGSSRSAGMELMLSKTDGRLTGWMAYTLSRTMMTFNDINNGSEFPASFDRPHDFSIVSLFQIRPRWQVSASWIIMSGSAYSSPTGFYIYNNYQVPVYELKNNERLPVYHRLDLATELQLNKTGSKSEHKIKFSLFNAYGRKNPIAVNYNKISDEENNIMVPVNHTLLPGLVNTMTYLFTVVPSFSYSFSF